MASCGGADRWFGAEEREDEAQGSDKRGSRLWRHGRSWRASIYLIDSDIVSSSVAVWCSSTAFRRRKTAACAVDLKYACLVKLFAMRGAVMRINNQR